MVARRRCRGFTFIWVLLMAAVLGMGTAAAAKVWTTHAQREREVELLFVGEQFRRAIGRYYESTPGPLKRFPRTLDELVEDRRFPVPRRHLRRIYVDPMTRARDWGLVLAADKTIMGVYSKASGAPYRSNVPRTVTVDGTGYGRWQFVYVLGGPGSPQAAPAARVGSAAPSQAPLLLASEPQPETSPVLTVLPKAVPDNPDKREKPNECVSMRAADLATCAAIASNPGAFEACRRSSNRRYSMCTRGASPPALATQ